MNISRLKAKTKKSKLNTKFIFRYLILAAICICTAVTYVWQRNQVISMGYGIGELKKKAEILDEERNKLEAQLLALKSPRRIYRLVNERMLGLQQVEPEQIVYLTRPQPLKIDKEETPIRSPYDDRLVQDR